MSTNDEEPLDRAGHSMVLRGVGNVQFTLHRRPTKRCSRNFAVSTSTDGKDLERIIDCD